MLRLSYERLLRTAGKWVVAKRTYIHISASSPFRSYLGRALGGDPSFSLKVVCTCGIYVCAVVPADYWFLVSGVADNMM